jgi:uncharacterized UBP type Zn finger protein
MVRNLNLNLNYFDTLLSNIFMSPFFFRCYKCDSGLVPTTGRNQVIAEAQSFLRKHFRNEEDEDDREERERRGLFTSLLNSISNFINYLYSNISLEAIQSQKRWRVVHEVTAPGLSNLGNTCFFNSVMQVFERFL